VWGFEVVERVSSTVLCGHVDDAAELVEVFAGVQGLGLEVLEVHQVPPRAVERGEAEAEPDRRSEADDGADDV
jgi:hypothetical protein